MNDCYILSYVSGGKEVNGKKPCKNCLVEEGPCPPTGDCTEICKDKGFSGKGFCSQDPTNSKSRKCYCRS